MNIILWLLQILVAMFCMTGSVWRLLNYEQAANDVASLRALPFEVWNAIGVFEIVCALGLILPGIIRKKKFLTPVAAACLAVEMLLVSALHINFFGFQFEATNPAVWSFSLCILAAFIAYGRRSLRPL